MLHSFFEAASRLEAEKEQFEKEVAIVRVEKEATRQRAEQLAAVLLERVISDEENLVKRQTADEKSGRCKNKIEDGSARKQVNLRSPKKLIERVSSESSRLKKLREKLRDETKKLRQEKEMKLENEEMTAQRRFGGDYHQLIQHLVSPENKWLEPEKSDLTMQHFDVSPLLDRGQSLASHLQEEQVLEITHLKAEMEELRLEKQLLVECLEMQQMRDGKATELKVRYRKGEEGAEEAARMVLENERRSSKNAETEVLEKVDKLMAQVQELDFPSELQASRSPEQEEALALADRLRRGHVALQNSARHKVEKAIAPLAMSSMLNEEENVHD